MQWSKEDKNRLLAVLVNAGIGKEKAEHCLKQLLYRMQKFKLSRDDHKRSLSRKEKQKRIADVKFAANDLKKLLDDPFIQSMLQSIDIPSEIEKNSNGQIFDYSREVVFAKVEQLAQDEICTIKHLVDRLSKIEKFLNEPAQTSRFPLSENEKYKGAAKTRVVLITISSQMPFSNR